MKISPAAIYYTLLSILVVTTLSCEPEETPMPDPAPTEGIIPIIRLNTDRPASEINKEDYMAASIEIAGTGDNAAVTGPIEIRGRGNSTWGAPKKPYQIRFEDKTSVMGMPEDRRWVLLAHYSDKSLLRTELAFKLGQMSNLNWSPIGTFVELYFNDEYHGLYQLSQKVEETKNRVDLSDEGYLLEVDQLDRIDPDDVYFETNRRLYNIKEPKLDEGDAQYEYIKNYITEVEDVLLGDDYLDPVDGYTKYIDVPSLIDWYLINEITRNTDSRFYSSAYLHHEPGEKLMFGPIWDFDLSLGNVDYNDNYETAGFYMKNSDLIGPLFDDPDFVAVVKDRFNHFYAEKDVVIEHIRDLEEVLATSQNYTRWPTLGEYVWPNHVYFDTYEEEVDFLENWFSERMEWLNVAINDL